MHRLLQMLMKLADGGAKAHCSPGHKTRLLGQAAGKLSMLPTEPMICASGCSLRNASFGSRLASSFRGLSVRQGEMRRRWSLSSFAASRRQRRACSGARESNNAE